MGNARKNKHVIVLSYNSNNPESFVIVEFDETWTNYDYGTKAKIPKNNYAVKASARRE